MKLINDDVNKIIRNIIGKRDPLLAEILINWTNIVGHKFGQKSSPLRISTHSVKNLKISTLYIRVENSGLSLEMSFQQDVIIERIAVYLGFKAIHQLRLLVL